MSDNEKLIWTMDFFIENCQDSGNYQDCRHCCEDNMKNCDHSENADLIKLRLQAQLSDDLVVKITNMTDLEFCYREINRCKNGIKYSPEVPAKKEWWQENLKHFKSIYKLLQGKG
ncbi:MAG TPA: hypothetical protein ENI23_04400 [bacterium]|nr:hypothetical protein [bacterium]